MKLHEYLSSEGALTVSQLRALIHVKSDAQIRQWQHAYSARKPSPEYCVSIEKATEGKVMRWELRPDDWHAIWPELIGAKGAPDVPSEPRIGKDSRAADAVVPIPDRERRAQAAIGEG
ncbi:transcriptional regulator [Caenimonas terrae]|uniref:Transcriptional regulator n=1 Tax=Caenimonas terrae TaxID=696074 RepID=A0ABW0NC88_9BURK